jgi:uncharacterized protein (UPF0297 family)
MREPAVLYLYEKRLNSLYHSSQWSSLNKIAQLYVGLEQTISPIVAKHANNARGQRVRVLERPSVKEELKRLNDVPTNTALIPSLLYDPNQFRDEVTTQWYGRFN